MGISSLRYRVALAALVLLLLATGASAIERPFIYQGTVERVDEAARNVTILPFAEYAGGAWTGAEGRPLVGTAPAGADLAALRAGTTVEAASLGAPGGRWTMLAPVVSLSSRPVALATALYGDPAFLVSRFPGELQVQYATSGDCANASGARSANVTVVAGEGPGEVRTLALLVGEEKTADLNGTALRVRFNGGQVSSGCPPIAGPQPVADFTILASTDPSATPTTARTSEPNAPGEETPGFSALLGLAALAGAVLLVRRR